MRNIRSPVGFELTSMTCRVNVLNNTTTLQAQGRTSDTRHKFHAALCNRYLMQTRQTLTKVELVIKETNNSEDSIHNKIFLSFTDTELHKIITKNIRSSE